MILLVQSWVVWFEPTPGIDDNALSFMAAAIPGPGPLTVTGPKALAARRPKKRNMTPHFSSHAGHAITIA